MARTANLVMGGHHVAIACTGHGIVAVSAPLGRLCERHARAAPETLRPAFVSIFRTETLGLVGWWLAFISCAAGSYAASIQVAGAGSGAGAASIILVPKNFAPVHKTNPRVAVAKRNASRSDAPSVRDGVARALKRRRLPARTWACS